MKKRIISALAALFLIASPLPLRSEAASAPKVYINGQRVGGDMPTEIVGGTSYVALRGAGDLMGAEVSWDKASRTAAMKTKGLKLTAGEGDIHIEANGRALYAPSGVFVRQGRLMVPCRLLARALGGAAQWEASSRSVYITTGSPIAHGDSVYREDELMWLSRIISAESRGEPMAGQAAVGGVVLNRVGSAEFPGTIYGVIFDRHNGVQFEPVLNGSVWDEPTEDAVAAAKLCLEGVDLSRGAMFFYNPDLAQNSWIGRSRPYIMTIGKHRFHG